MSDNESYTAAEEIVGIFIKAVKKSEKKLRKAGFESYYDMNKAEETHARLTAAVVATLSMLAMDDGGGCGECEGCEEYAASTSVTYEEDTPEFEVWNLLPEPETVSNFYSTETARETAEKFERIMREGFAAVDAQRAAAQVGFEAGGMSEEERDAYMGEMADKSVVDALRQRIMFVAEANEPDKADAVEYDPKGWPLNTSVNDMSKDEQILWWKHQARKNEARAKKYYREANEIRGWIEERREANERRMKINRSITTAPMDSWWLQVPRS